MALKEHGQSTTDVRQGYQLDAAKLEPYLLKTVPGVVVPIKVSQFKLGQSNPTYLLTDANWISAVDTLAKLHKVNHVAIGLESYGRATGFFRRQIASLSKIAGAQAAVKDTEGVAVGPILGVDELAEWFKKYEVEDSTSIVHGDYK
ncbi:hypothetical protein BGZ65_009405, partial [Modicella reniformis]